MNALIELFVANIAFEATREDLKQLFETVGVGGYAKIVFDGPSGQSKGYGFVQMLPDDAQLAITKLHGSKFFGRPLVVKLSEPREPRFTLKDGAKWTTTKLTPS
jgi:RNA recognition motif-containing protein